MFNRNSKDEKEQQRELVRVEVAFDISFYLLDNENYEGEKRRILAAPTSEKGHHGPLKDEFNEVELSDLDTATANMWITVNKKLDYIIHLLAESREAKSANDHNGFCVDLSGSGARIVSRDKPKVGQYIKMKILPIAYPPFLVEIIGKISRVGRSEICQEDEVELGVEFDVVNEVDRELLIKHLFKRQRERLRAGIK